MQEKQILLTIAGIWLCSLLLMIMRPRSDMRPLCMMICMFCPLSLIFNFYCPSDGAAILTWHSPVSGFVMSMTATLVGIFTSKKSLL